MRLRHANQLLLPEDVYKRQDPLWKTMAKKKATTYTLRVTFGMSHATVQRLQSNLPVTTHTLDKLCKSLDCRLEDIAEYVPDDPK